MTTGNTTENCATNSDIIHEALREKDMRSAEIA
jgi:hypothetical protein